MSNMNPRPYWRSVAWLFALCAAAIAADQTQSTSQVPLNLYQSMRWRNIGPIRGGRSVAVAGVIGHPRTYYFGGAGGGLYKTTNDGISWTNVTDGYLKTSSVGAVAVAPSDPNIVYLGMGEYAIRDQAISWGDGVYRSTDRGKSWKHVGLASTRVISRIRVNPGNPEIVYVAAQGTAYVPSVDRGIYRTVDGGGTWHKVLFVNDTTGAADLAMDPTNPRILYAAMWDHQRKPWFLRSGGPGSAIYKTTDGGDHWQKIVSGMPEIMGRIGIEVSANPDRLFALVECEKSGLYRSDDAGQNWVLVNGSRSLIARAWYYTHFAADPKNADVLWVFNSSIHKSIDAGHTFEVVDAPHGDFHDAWINPNDPDNLIIATDGGGTITHDAGASWSSMDNQATGQFYRVLTDGRFPYYVYGAQQDATTVAIASASPQHGIGWKDWYQVGGCESGWVALDPRNSRLVYAGCQEGQITEFDTAIKDVRNIMPYPVSETALPLKSRKYRFNWSAPLVLSKFDGALYFGAQKLLRSDDRGHTWREISPHLTHPTPETMDAGEGPFQHEDQVYHTIFCVAESPHDKNVLWTGSDDGVIAITRDAGKNWKRFSLPGLADAQIASIEISPYDPGSAYVAATRYKFNDFKPYFFKTSDFGANWNDISAGIPAESRSHVIREDPVRKGLLYAGTETGVSVSFDDGTHWQSLQLNLPVTPVTDLQVHDTDLVASTQGRAFWILDDVSPLRQVNEKVAASAAFLFQPRIVYRSNLGLGDLLLTDSPYIYRQQATNAPVGAVIDFYLPKVGSVALEIRDAAGQVVRHYSSESGAANYRGALKVTAGMNRMTWDLHHDPLGAPGVGVAQGRIARPERYQIRLTAVGQTASADLDVEPDPRVDVPPDTFARQGELLAQLDSELGDLYQSVSQIRDLRRQLKALMERTSDPAVTAAAKSLLGQVNEIEHSLMPPPGGGPIDVLGYAPLAPQFASVRNEMNRVTPEITQAQVEAVAELGEQWSDYKQRLSSLFTTELESLNRLAVKSNVPVVILQKQGNAPPDMEEQP